MTTSRLISDTVSDEPLVQTDEDGVHEPPAAGLSVQCQPYAVRGGNDIMWPGTITDLSAETLALALERRFEPQTLLSLALPETASSPASSLVARVNHVERHGDGRWLLDCVFLNPIDAPRLAALREALKAPPAASATDPASSVVIEKATVTGVLFQVRYGNSEPIRRAISRLHVNGSWPLTIGRAMKAWVGDGPSNDTATNVRVNGCYHQNGEWLVDCSFLGTPPDLLLEKLRTGVM